MGTSFKKVADGFQKIAKILLAGFYLLFGSFKYSPPDWWTRAITRIKKTRFGNWCARQCDWMRANPRRATGFFSGALAVCIGLALGIRWYLNYLDSLPKPNYVEVTIHPPQEPDLETDKQRNLVLAFSRSAAQIKSLDKPIAKGVSISPSIQGIWRWESDKNLVFTPDSSETSRWQIGQEYTVKLSKEIFPAHVLLKETIFKFKTPQLVGEVNKQEFYQDPRDPKIKRGVINLRYNYSVDTEDVKKRINLKLQSKDESILGEKPKSISFTVNFNKYKNEVYIISDPLEIPKQDSILRGEVDKGVRGAKGGQTGEMAAAQIIVPGLFEYFKFSRPEISFARNEKFEPEQILILKTRSGVSSEEIAKRLKFSLLPIKHPKHKEKIWHWSSASEATEIDVSTKLTPVAFELVPAPTEQSEVHTFKVNVPVGRFALVQIPKGLKSFGGYELAKDFEDVVRAPEYPKELMIMSQGSILSLSGDKKIPLLGRNIREVSFDVSRILPNQLNQFIYHALNMSGDFKQPLFSLVPEETLAEIYQKKIALPFKSPAETQYFSFDLEPYLNKEAGGKRGLFFIRAREPKADKSDQRLILLTDLGVIVKESVGRNHDVFVQNLRTGMPVAGADVEVVGANGIAILEQKTNSEGRAIFPDLTEFKKEKAPLAFVVKKDGDLSFLPFRMQNRRLDFSKFDVGGLHEQPSGDELAAYMFSERGIYRPGDAANIGLLVRSRNWKKSFQDVPVVWTVTDSRGTEIKREKIKVDSAGMSSLNFATQDYSPTGTYSVRVFITKKNDVMEVIGSINIRVEEFVPDRMRISTKLSRERLQGWISPENLKGEVTLTNLFGAPAENRRVNAKITLVPTIPTFRAFKDYRFAPLRGDEKPYEEKLETTKTDAKGHAEFELNLARFSTSIWNLRFDAEGFEATGGRGVAASSGVLVSALPHLVGIKIFEDLNYLKKGSHHEIDVLAVGPDLKKIALKGLKLVMVERKFVSALTQQNDGTYKYQSVVKEVIGESKNFDINETGTRFKIPTDKPGDYVAVFKESNDVELNRIGFSVAGEANLSRNLEKNAELQVVLNRRDFKSTDEIEMQIKAPYTGAGLITIERDKVLSFKWFKMSTTSKVEKIKIPEGLEGNAYVNVTFLRGLDSPEIFMSPLSYAVQPFSVSLDEHKVAINLDVPERVKPGERLKIHYSANRKTKLILYGVDEGILQVAQYKLPDPLSFFFQRRALQVKTFQLLDLLLPEYSLIQGFAAPGGDSDGAAMLGRNLNPFKRKTDKPVVFWSGVIEAGPNKKDFEYEVPEYFNGNIKVMAVASAGASFGSLEQGVLSRGDFILNSSLPLFVAPGDEFQVGVGISNQAEGTGADAKIKVEVQASDFDIVGDKTKTVGIAEGREGVAEFRLKAKSKLGSSVVKVLATSEVKSVLKSAKTSSEASIRPAVPFMTSLIAGFAQKPAFEIAIERKMLPEFRTQSVGMSPVPLILGQGLKQYLDVYPYGCTEQILSKSFPYVVLKNRPEFGIDLKKAAEMFSTTLALIRARQSASGAFALYEGGAENLPTSLYATHFLIEARDRGFNVSEEVLSRAMGYVQSETVRDVSSISKARLFAYALYLQARMGKVPGADVSFLRKALGVKLKDSWETDLTAGFLAATYKILKQDDDARVIFKKLKIGSKIVPDYEFFHDGFVRDTALLLLAALHFPESLKDFAGDKAIQTAFQPLANRQYNTHSAAWSILALDALVAQASTAQAMQQMKVSEINSAGVAQVLSLPNSPAPMVSFSDSAAKLKIEVPKDLPFYYMMNQSGFDREMPGKEIKKKLEITREYLSSSGLVVQSAKVGETLQVRLRIRSLDVQSVSHVAIVDLLPGGFEPILEKYAVSEEESNAVSGHEEGDSHGEGDGVPQEPPAHLEGEEGGDEGASLNLLKMILPFAYAQQSSQLSLLRPNYVDRREDRMVIYTFVSGEIREFTYKVKAVNQGQFVVPPPFAEGMYDRDVQYRGLHSTIKVEAP